jgi:hypothetical protein
MTRITMPAAIPAIRWGQKIRVRSFIAAYSPPPSCRQD